MIIISLCQIYLQVQYSLLKMVHKKTKPNPEAHPTLVYCSEITNLKHDNIDLSDYCQMHKYSGCCLIHTKNTRTKTKFGHTRRECRFNAGIGETPGKADTLGPKLQTETTITSKPLYPDYEHIAEVADYIAGYVLKGEVVWH